MCKYRQSKRVVARQVRGERILVPIADSEEALDSIYILNETASFIWDQIEEEKNIKEIISNLTEEYDVDYARAEVDTGVVLNDLVDVNAAEQVNL